MIHLPPLLGRFSYAFWCRAVDSNHCSGRKDEKPAARHAPAYIKIAETHCNSTGSGKKILKKFEKTLDIYAHYAYNIIKQEVNGLSPKEIEKLIVADGWVHKKTKGDHKHFVHPTKPGKVTIPMSKKKSDLHPKTVASILKQAGLK